MINPTNATKRQTQPNILIIIGLSTLKSFLICSVFSLIQKEIKGLARSPMALRMGPGKIIIKIPIVENKTISRTLIFAFKFITFRHELQATSLRVPLNYTQAACYSLSAQCRWLALPNTFYGKKSWP